MGQDKYSDELTPSQIKELEEIMGELTDTAKEVEEDFEKNPTDLNSGSYVQIHHESPFLDADDDDNPRFDGDRWKSALKQGLPIPPKNKDIPVKKSKKSSKKSKKDKK